MATTTFFLTTGRLGFPQVCNPSLARAWAFYLGTDRFAPAALSGLDDAQQRALVVEFYEGLASTFRALNARPYGWKFYRSQLERVLGRLDTASAIWVGGEWNNAFTDAWALAGNDITRLRETVFVAVDSNGRDQHRIWLNNDGRVEQHEAPSRPTEGLVVSSRLGWATETGEDPTFRLLAVPSWEAYLTLGRVIAAKLYEQTASVGMIKALLTEIRTDVEDKNFATAWGAGIPVTELPGYADLQRREQVTRQRDEVSRVTGTMAGIAAAVSAIPGAQVAGLVIGLVAAVIEVVSRLVGFASSWQRDVFGRAEPAFEAYRFDDSLSETAAVWPAGPPGWVDTDAPGEAGRARPLRPGQSEIAEMGARNRAFFGQPVEALVRAARDELPSLDAPGGTPLRVVVESRSSADLPSARVWLAATEIPRERFNEVRPFREDGIFEWAATVTLPTGQWRVVAYVVGRVAQVLSVETPTVSELRLKSWEWRRTGRILPPPPPPPLAPPEPARGGGGLLGAVVVGSTVVAGIVIAATVAAKGSKK